MKIELKTPWWWGGEGGCKWMGQTTTPTKNEREIVILRLLFWKNWSHDKKDYKATLEIIRQKFMPLAPDPILLPPSSTWSPWAATKILTAKHYPSMNWSSKMMMERLLRLNLKKATFRFVGKKGTAAKTKYCSHHSQYCCLPKWEERKNGGVGWWRDHIFSWCNQSNHTNYRNFAMIIHVLIYPYTSIVYRTTQHCCKGYQKSHVGWMMGEIEGEREEAEMQ